MLLVAQLMVILDISAVNVALPDMANNLTILGTGSMGQAIAAVAGKGGHTVQLLGPGRRRHAGQRRHRGPRGALPRRRRRRRAARREASPAGSSSTSPTRWTFETFDSLTVAADGSAAAEIAAALPQLARAQGVQHHLRWHPRRRHRRTTHHHRADPGDDAEAKSALAGVVTSGGLKAIDAGSLKRARELEAVGFLQLTLAANEKVSWTGGFGVVA